jgi:predicted dehydrogenase
VADLVKMAIVGCGGMGRRHLTGLHELAKSDFNNIELAAVCDLNEANAESLADEAKELLGYRPRVFTSAAAMVEQVDGLQAADCTTDTGSHHKVATALLDLGLHTLCEKPLALTIRGCHQIINAAHRNNRTLSIAENFRRDPINRLIRALLDDGAIGNRQFMMETGVGGRDSMLITPWRHMKMSGTITLDAGVHDADILQYYLGDPVSAYGQTRLYEKTRIVRETSGPGGFYAKWAANLPESFEATGEDAMFGLINFENGAIAQWVDHYAGHGEPFNHRILFGTKGSIASPGDRNGRPVRLVLDSGEVTGEAVLEYAPSYKLDPVAANLFGAERPWTYSFEFNHTDRKLLALEQWELANCVRTGETPEVDSVAGMRAVALVYALFESQVEGRPVTIAEVETLKVDGYQREIDQQLGLI